MRIKVYRLRPDRRFRGYFLNLPDAVMAAEGLTLGLKSDHHDEKTGAEIWVEFGSLDDGNFQEYGLCTYVRHKREPGSGMAGAAPYSWDVHPKDALTAFLEARRKKLAAEKAETEKMRAVPGS